MYQISILEKSRKKVLHESENIDDIKTCGKNSSNEIKLIHYLNKIDDETHIYFIGQFINGKFIEDKFNNSRFFYSSMDELRLNYKKRYTKSNKYDSQKKRIIVERGTQMQLIDYPESLYSESKLSSNQKGLDEF
jgi:hypothetical protein